MLDGITLDCPEGKECQAANGQGQPLPDQREQLRCGHLKPGVDGECRQRSIECPLYAISLQHVDPQQSGDPRQGRKSHEREGEVEQQRRGMCCVLLFILYS
jgi:hypothetical protein